MEFSTDSRISKPLLSALRLSEGELEGGKVVDALEGIELPRSDASVEERGLIALEETVIATFDADLGGVRFAVVRIVFGVISFTAETVGVGGLFCWVFAALGLCSRSSNVGSRGLCASVARLILFRWGTMKTGLF